MLLPLGTHVPLFSLVMGASDQVGIPVKHQLPWFGKLLIAIPLLNQEGRMGSDDFCVCVSVPLCLIELSLL